MDLKKEWLKPLDLIYYPFPEGSDESVQQGLRPALILWADQEHLLLAAITSQMKKRMPTHIELRTLSQRSSLKENSSILMEQLFWVARKDVVGYAGKVYPTSKDEIYKRLKISLGMKRAPFKRDGDPKVYRGQVFSLDGHRLVVVQNNIGNTFSPTTIIGFLDKKGSVKGFQTIRTDRLTNLKSVKRIHNLSVRIGKFLPNEILQ